MVSVYMFVAAYETASTKKWVIATQQKWNLTAGMPIENNKDAIRFVTAYTINIPRSDEWLDTRIEIEPATVLLVNYENGTGHVDFKIGPYLDHIDKPADPYPYYFVFLSRQKMIKDGPEGLEGIIKSHEHILVRATERDVVIRLEIWFSKNVSERQKIIQ